MFTKSATASAVIESLTGQSAGLAPVLLELVARLHEIEEIIAESGDDGHTKNQTIREASESGISVQEFLIAQQAMRDAYAELYELVWGEPESGANNSELIAEGKEIYAKVKQGAMTIEKFFGETGFVNALFNVIPKPEGVGIRKQFKDFAGYQGK